MATIFDLRSGDPRLIIDTGMKICGLGVTGNTVIVVGEGKITTWDLPEGDGVLNAKANAHDSVRTVVFNHPAPPPTRLDSASISPDFNYIAIGREDSKCLEIYDISTGKRLAVTTTTDVRRPWFTRDGREVWSSRAFPKDGWKITKSGESDVIELEPLRPNTRPSGGYLWESPHGHDVARDGWILDSRGKRLVWLPHFWRVYKRYPIWDGRFLVLSTGLHGLVILELDE
jgi:WD40 repeat protein